MEQQIYILLQYIFSKKGKLNLVKKSNKLFDINI